MFKKEFDWADHWSSLSDEMLCDLYECYTSHNPCGWWSLQLHITFGKYINELTKVMYLRKLMPDKVKDKYKKVIHVCTDQQDIYDEVRYDWFKEKPKYWEGDTVRFGEYDLTPLKVEKVLYDPVRKIFLYILDHPGHRPFPREENILYPFNIARVVKDKCCCCCTCVPIDRAPKYKHGDKVSIHGLAVYCERIIDKVSYCPDDDQICYTFIDPGNGPSRVAEYLLLPVRDKCRGGNYYPVFSCGCKYCYCKETK